MTQITTAPKFRLRWIAGGRQSTGKFIVENRGDTVCTVWAGQFEHYIDFAPSGEGVVGAGAFAKDGTVIEWASDSLQVQTPLELREALQTLLREGAHRYWQERKAR